MAAVIQRVRAMVGKISYNRWVLYARHEQEFGRRSSMMLMNAAFAGMFGFIVLDAAQHHRQHVNKDYIARKAALAATISQEWEAELGLHSMNVEELEESVFRARKGEQHESLTKTTESGTPIVWHNVDMVSVPLPIAALESFAPARA